jgi:hypothetical protein
MLFLPKINVSDKLLLNPTLLPHLSHNSPLHLLTGVSLHDQDVVDLMNLERYLRQKQASLLSNNAMKPEDYLVFKGVIDGILARPKQTAPQGPSTTQPSFPANAQSFGHQGPAYSPGASTNRGSMPQAQPFHNGNHGPKPQNSRTSSPKSSTPFSLFELNPANPQSWKVTPTGAKVILKMTGYRLDHAMSFSADDCKLLNETAIVILNRSNYACGKDFESKRRCEADKALAISAIEMVLSKHPEFGLQSQPGYDKVQFPRKS